MIALGCALLLSGCSSSATPASSSNPTVASSAPREVWSVVALGDSVPRGTNCGCTPYPQLTASYLTASDRREVKATNDAVGGFTSTDVVKQLRSDSDVISDVANADVVEIEIGANDVAYSGSCGTSVACYQPMISSTERNLAQIVTRVHELTEGRPVLADLAGLLERLARRSVRQGGRGRLCQRGGQRDRPAQHRHQEDGHRYGLRLRRPSRGIQGPGLRL